MNKSRPLIGTISLSKTGSFYKLDYPDWPKKNRDELYFMRKPEYYNIYKNVALIARKKKCEVIDLEISTMTWQYPLMIFIKKELSNPNIIFRQVNVKNLSKYKKQKIRNFNKKFLCKIVESEKDRNLELR